MTVAAATKLLLALPGVERGLSYGMPSFLLHGHFLARFRDDDTVLVIRLASIGDREMLMKIDPETFFFTEHYRNYPAVLVRLSKVRPALLRDVLDEAHKVVAAKSPKRPRKPRSRRAGGAT